MIQILRKQINGFPNRLASMQGRQVEREQYQENYAAQIFT
jgi:hypothetical protein